MSEANAESGGGVAVQRMVRRIPCERHNVWDDGCANCLKRTIKQMNLIMAKSLTIENSVRAAEPLLKHYERQLASSLSCDSRSHDNDREPRRMLNAILDAIKPPNGALSDPDKGKL